MKKRITAVLLLVLLLSSCGGQGVGSVSSVSDSGTKDDTSVTGSAPARPARPAASFSPQSQPGMALYPEPVLLTREPIVLPDVVGSRWVKHPYVVYDSLAPLRGQEDYSTISLGFLAIKHEGLWGMMRFDGEVGYGPTQEYPPTMCGDHEVHNVPWEFSEYEHETNMFNPRLIDLGFTYPVRGGHGRSTYFFVFHPNSGKLSLCYASDSGMGTEDIEEYKRWPGCLPVLTYCIAPSWLREDCSNLYINAEEIYTMIRSGVVGLATIDKKILLPAEYKGNYNECRGGMYPLKSGDKWGYYSVEQRRFVTNFAYSGLWNYYSDFEPSMGFFNEGLCPVNVDGKYGFIDTEGKAVTAFEFEDATHVFQGRAWVKKAGAWGLIEFVR